jgi:SWI/SNF-related matrix-associated actin-dependent regulator of chromatin subfamily A-like protein 1
MKAYPNRYKGKCEVCRCWVQPNNGFICSTGPREYVRSKYNDKYIACWCSEHVPHGKPTEGERRLDAQGRCITPYEPRNLDLIRSFPGARWRPLDSPENTLGKPYWQVSLEMCDRRRVLEIADKMGLEVDPSLRQVTNTAQSLKARHVGLYPFQVEGVDWLGHSLNKARLLGDDMGLGKTVQALVALPDQAATIVVCPAALKYNWQAECRKWRSDLTPVVLEGRNSFRFPKPGEIIITNYDILPKWLEPVAPFENAKRWQYVVRLPLSTKEAAKEVVTIVDECQRIKNGKTARAKRVNGLGMVTGTTWALTGTPLENRPLDLWGILVNLGMSRTVFGKFERFLDVMNGCKGPWGGYEFGMPKPQVADLMRRVMLRRRREEVLPDLPRKTYHTIEVDLPENLQQEMDDLWEEWCETIMEAKELPPFEEFSAVRAALAKSRIPALIDLVEDHEEQGVPLVVFSAHKAPIESCGAREGWAIITGETPAVKRQAIVEDFQAGKLKGIALTIRAGGVGLTLTRAWKSIFVDLDWVPSQNQQAEDRICRIGQTAAHCEIVRMVSRHVLDQHVLELIAWKVAVIEQAIERVQKGHKPEPSKKPEPPKKSDDHHGEWPNIVRDELIPF